MYKFLTFFEYVSQKINKFIIALNIKAEGESKQTLLFGIFGLVNFPTFYFVWHDLSPQRYDSLTLRLVATALCLSLILKKFWPSSLKPYFGVFWYVTLIYCLSFFGTFMLLQNHGSPMWVTNAMLVLMLLTILLDWISFSVVLIIGITIATLLSLTGNHAAFGYTDYAGIFATYFSAIVVAAIFTYGRDKVEAEKFQAIKSVGASMAHELRTPLLSLDGGITGIKRYFPKFIQTYELAKESGLKVPPIRQDRYQNLLVLLDNMSEEVKYSNTIVDMLLMKVKQTSIQLSDAAFCSMVECVSEALRRYPFASENQRQLIRTEGVEDFKFKGDQLLIVHVLFNLLKNSLYFIDEVQKGDISIWTSRRKHTNRLHFKDTAKGIPSSIKWRMFESFFTTTRNGTGLGLAFCKMVMINLGGDIACYSKENEYAEFVLIFPKI